MIKVVVFDLDDTLISEAEYVASGFRTIARSLAGSYPISEGVALEALRRAFDESPRNVFDRVAAELLPDGSPEVVGALVEAYRTHVPEISFYTDVRPCLEGLREQGVKTGILTDGLAVAQHRKLAAVDAASVVDVIVVSDDLGREYWKPHERPFEVVRERLGVEFGEMAYVADNPGKDFAIAARYPISTVRIMREHSVYAGAPYLGGVREAHRINDLADLATVLGLRPWTEG